MSKHTPGPWTINHRDENLVETKSGLQIASISWNREEIHANANLIVAAPDLLNAANNSIMIIERMLSREEDSAKIGDLVSIAEYLQRAIAKAEGK